MHLLLGSLRDRGPLRLGRVRRVLAEAARPRLPPVLQAQSRVELRGVGSRLLLPALHSGRVSRRPYVGVHPRGGFLTGQPLLSQRIPGHICPRLLRPPLPPKHPHPPLALTRRPTHQQSKLQRRPGLLRTHRRSSVNHHGGVCPRDPPHQRGTQHGQTGIQLPHALFSRPPTTRDRGRT